MKRTLAWILVGVLFLTSLSACGIWAEEEAPTETTEFIITQ